MEKHRFVKIRRGNGELIILNLDHVSMVFADPADKSILVVGTGFEKRLRPEDGLTLLQMIDGMSIDPTEISHAT